MKKHYRVDNEAQKVIANIELLTEEEFLVIEKYKRLGYSIVNGKVSAEKKAGAKKRLTDEYIREYLEGNEKALAKYEDAINETATEEDGTAKLTSKGKARKKGFNAGRHYFARTFPEDISELKYTKSQEAEFRKAWERYSGSEKAVMNKEEYKRYYYWTKIFESK